MTSQARPAEFAGLTESAAAGPVSPEARRWLDGAAVERPVLELRPDYAALIIVAEGLRPGPSDEATDALLRDAEARAKAALAGRDPGELAPVAAWRAAYQAFGAKPKRTRPSSKLGMKANRRRGRSFHRLARAISPARPRDCQSFAPPPPDPWRFRHGRRVAHRPRPPKLPVPGLP